MMEIHPKMLKDATAQSDLMTELAASGAKQAVTGHKIMASFWDAGRDVADRPCLYLGSVTIDGKAYAIISSVDEKIMAIPLDRTSKVTPEPYPSYNTAWIGGVCITVSPDDGRDGVPGININTDDWREDERGQVMGYVALGDADLYDNLNPAWLTWDERAAKARNEGVAAEVHAIVQTQPNGAVEVVWTSSSQHAEELADDLSMDFGMVRIFSTEVSPELTESEVQQYLTGFLSNTSETEARYVQDLRAYAHPAEETAVLADRWMAQDGGFWMAVAPGEDETEWFADWERDAADDTAGPLPERRVLPISELPAGPGRLIYRRASGDEVNRPA